MKSTFKKGGIQESRQGQILDSRKWGGHRDITVNMIIPLEAHILAILKYQTL